MEPSRRCAVVSGRAAKDQDIFDDKWLLRLPNPAGRTAVDGMFHAERLVGFETGFEHMKPHDILGGIVQHESEKIGIDDGMQAQGKLMEQRLQIAMLRDDFADVEQRFQLTPGVIKHRGRNCLRRRNRRIRHAARIAPRGRPAQPEQAGEEQTIRIHCK